MAFSFYDGAMIPLKPGHSIPEMIIYRANFETSLLST